MVGIKPSSDNLSKKLSNCRTLPHTRQYFASSGLSHPQLLHFIIITFLSITLLYQNELKLLAIIQEGTCLIILIIHLLQFLTQMCIRRQDHTFPFFSSGSNSSLSSFLQNPHAGKHTLSYLGQTYFRPKSLNVQEQKNHVHRRDERILQRRHHQVLFYDNISYSIIRIHYVHEPTLKNICYTLFYAIQKLAFYLSAIRRSFFMYDMY